VQAFQYPNSSLGVSRTHIVSVDDDRIRVYDKCSNLLLAETPIDGPGGFWAAQGATQSGFLSETKVTYDHASGRFFATAHTVSEFPGNWYIAFTETGDATGTWYKHQVPAPYGVDSIYSAQLAIDRNDVWLSAQVTAAALFPDYTWVLGRFDKVWMITNPTNPNIPQYWQLVVGTADADFEVPAQRVSFETEAIQYAVDIEGTSMSALYDKVALYAFTFDPSTGITVKKGPKLITVTPYINGQSPAQPLPGQPLAIDLLNHSRRFQSASFNRGKLWTAHAVGNQSPPAGLNRMVIRWYCFDMNNWDGTSNGAQPTLAQTGVIDGGPGTWAFCPSIAVTRSGDVGITYNQCGASEYLSIRQRSRCNTDPLNTMPTASVLYQAAVAYAPNVPPVGPADWAFYTNTTSDPAVSNRLWTHHFGLKVINPSIGPFSDQWLTHIARYEPACTLDINGDGLADNEDGPAFMQAMQAGEPEADLELDQATNADDALKFQALNGPQ
jgi:hypothetical protein